MVRFLVPEDVVDVENVITVLVVVSVVFGTLAWFRQDPTGVPRRFIFEYRVADSVGCR